MQLPDVRDPGDGTRHGGQLALDMAVAHGVERMFTLSGAHVFPLYDAAVTAEPPVPIVDVRHEQTAVFAAEATAKLTRRPGLAVLTAGPGVTNGISAVAQASASGVPLLVLGGRAPARGWGRGALQELDHPALLAAVTRSAATAATVTEVPTVVDAALRTARTAHRGPVFVDVPVDELFSRAPAGPATASPPLRRQPDPGDLAAVATELAAATRPVLVLGGDVWLDGAEQAALRFVEALGLPAVTNGLGRGVLPRGHRHLVTRARAAALQGADLVLVVGTPLDFRLSYGRFGGPGGQRARVVHLADSPGLVAEHADLAASAAGDLTAVLDGVLAAVAALPRQPHRSTWSAWAEDMAAATTAARARDAELLGAGAAAGPVHPARILGELAPLLADDAVVVGDGGDFVSFAGRLVEPARAGCWLDPGPFGCLGAGLGAVVAARLARPASQVVGLLGDGAAGMSLLDVDTLVRHELPAVIVVANNGAWGLEKHPMRQLYGYDVAADLRAETRYDDVVRALGGAGETVTRADELGPALRRGMAAGVPYLVNVQTDPAVAYPRQTTGL